MRARQRWTLFAVCTATFMLLVDISIVNVALPRIQRELHASLTDLQWIVDAYAVSLAALLLGAGALADRVGRRMIFTAGVATFTLASLACGLSSTPTVLDLSRAIQGVGGAAMFATTLALIAQEYQGRERASAIAAWGATVGGAVAIGPLVGGALTGALSWRWIFFVNLPIGAVTLLVARIHVRESRSPAAGSLDLVGLITFSAALFLLVLGLLRGNADGWRSAWILLALGGASVLLCTFIALERRQERPMLDLALFRKPSFVGVSVAVFCLGAGMFSLIAFLSVYLQDVTRYSPLQAGLRLLPMTAFVFIAPLALRRLPPLPARLAIAGGLALVSLGLLLMHGLAADSSWRALLAGLILAGLGIGVANPAIGATAIAVVHPSRAGMASGFNNTCRLSGIAMGIAVLGDILQHRIATSLTISAAHVHNAAAAVAAAGTRAADNAPPGVRAAIAHADATAFITGLNELFLIGAAIALTGAIGALALIRPGDFQPITTPATVTAAEPSSP